jgi:alpha-1,2-mannosyltransferase
MELLTSQQRLMIWLAVALAVQTLAMLGGYMLEVQHGAVFGGDFTVFWQTAQKLVSGQGATIYDPSALNKVLEGTVATTDAITPFVYPPPMALLIWPLGFFSYNIAVALWTVIPVILFYWLLWRVLVYSEKEGAKLYPLAAAVTLPFITVNIMSGQTGALIGVLFLAGLHGWQRKRWWAAIAFGTIIIKPQLGLLIPFLYIASKQWKLFGISALNIIALCALSTAWLGTDIWTNYFAATSLFGQFMHQGFGPYASLVTGPYLSLHTMGISSVVAVWIQVLVSVLVITVIMQLFKDAPHGSPCMRFGLIGCGALLATPHSMAYDTPLLAMAAATMLLSAWRKGWESSFELMAFIMLLLMPYLQPVLMHYGFAIGWIVLLVFFIALLRRYSKEFQQVK